MILPIDKIGEALAAWVDAELVPKASGLQKFATVMASLAIARRAPGIIAERIGELRALGLADEAGNILLEAMRDLAAEAMEKTGKITVAGIILGPEDIRSLYDAAAKFANE